MASFETFMITDFGLFEAIRCDGPGGKTISSARPER